MKKTVSVVLLVSCFIIQTASCLGHVRNEPLNVKNYEDRIRLACVGDSITYGATIEDPGNNGYPAQLQSLLGEKWQVINCGKNGATMIKNTGRPIWKESVFQEAIEFQPDVVIIMLGTNDAALRDRDKIKTEYTADCEEMVDLFLNLPSKPRLWLCRPVPLIPGRQDFRMDNLKNVVTPIVEQVAQEKGVGLIDMYAALDGYPELFRDKVHPNKDGATLIAREVYHSITGQKPPMPKMVDIGTLIAFGDSTTATRGELKIYSQLLQKELLKNQIQVDIINAGKGGNETSMARKRFENDVLSKKPDFVVIQFGINDSMVDVWKETPASSPRISKKAYEQNLTYFVTTLKECNIPVILMTPNSLRWTDGLKKLYGKPPYNTEDLSGLNVILKDYAQSVRKIAAEQKVPLVDIYAAFENYGRVAYQSVDDLLLDGIHPNDLGHRVVTYELRKQIEAFVRNK